MDKEFCMIETESALREILDTPIPIALRKVGNTLDAHCRKFISLSPFLCLATMSRQGEATVSPRGDPPGFVQVLDDKTLIIPDRPGNNVADSMERILEMPRAGVLFFIPGFDETLRVNGAVNITTDEGILSQCIVAGRTPKLALRLIVEEVFFHCGKSLKRSRLWDPDSRRDRQEMPSLARIILEQTADPDAPPTQEEVSETEKMVEKDYRESLY
jgi:PPOX class probable FMN-dependent enzyme